MRDGRGADGAQEPRHHRLGSARDLHQRARARVRPGRERRETRGDAIQTESHHAVQLFPPPFADSQLLQLQRRSLEVVVRGNLLPAVNLGPVRPAGHGIGARYHLLERKREVARVLATDAGVARRRYGRGAKDRARLRNFVQEPRPIADVLGRQDADEGGGGPLREPTRRRYRRDGDETRGPRREPWGSRPRSHLPGVSAPPPPRMCPFEAREKSLLTRKQCAETRVMKIGVSIFNNDDHDLRSRARHAQRRARGTRDNVRGTHGTSRDGQ